MNSHSGQRPPSQMTKTPDAPERSRSSTSKLRKLYYCPLAEVTQDTFRGGPAGGMFFLDFPNRATTITSLGGYNGIAAWDAYFPCAT